MRATEKVGLFLLYLNQGLPHGFQSQILIVDLLSRGHLQLSDAVDISLLMAPWTWKFLWAPFVDSYYFEFMGKRKSWIMPLLFVQMMLSIFIAVWYPSPLLGSNDNQIHVALYWFKVTLFIFNLATATEDIAVDGFAVDLLLPSPSSNSNHEASSTTPTSKPSQSNDVTSSNVIQVVGYKVGMLISGGILPFLNSEYMLNYSWRGIFGMMAGIYLFSLYYVGFVLKERSKSTSSLKQSKANNHHDTRGLFSTLKTLLQSITTYHQLIVFLLCFTYKMGENWIDTLYRPYLQHNRFSTASISFLSGIIGISFSTVGSVLAYFVKNRGSSFFHSLFSVYAIRLIPLWIKPLVVIMATDLSSSYSYFKIVASIIADNVISGILSPIMFAFMMASVNSEIGGTHFTLLATLEVIPKVFIIPPLALFFTTNHGFELSFAVGALLSLIPLFVFLEYFRRGRKEGESSNERKLC